MVKKYDILEIRRAARRVSSVADEISSANRQVKNMLGALPSAFEGEAATVLMEQLTALESDLSKLRSGLTQVGCELKDYATRIEEADREAAQFI